jgi:predicted pyridoxine 5'-phosphate oxidase superfamily flavin-nucleotide-binding protein
LEGGVGHDYLKILTTPLVRAAQDAHGSGDAYARVNRASDRFSPDEVSFIEAADSFYIASNSESGWPYVQHRGGPPGFLKVIDERTLGFADFRGNKQYITLGNVGSDDRVALFIMSYPHRARLKILGRLKVIDLESDPAGVERLVVAGYTAKVERGFELRLAAFDWNCPQHITPRFTEREIEAALAPMRAHIDALEADNARLRRLAGEGTDSPGR